MAFSLFGSTRRRNGRRTVSGGTHRFESGVNEAAGPQSKVANDNVGDHRTHWRGALSYLFPTNYAALFTQCQHDDVNGEIQYCRYHVQKTQNKWQNFSVKGAFLSLSSFFQEREDPLFSRTQSGFPLHPELLPSSASFLMFIK